MVKIMIEFDWRKLAIRFFDIITHLANKVSMWSQKKAIDLMDDD